jgi:prevent-host-death family protein
MEVIAASKARGEFASLIRHAAHDGRRTVIEHRGRPRAAIVPIEDLEYLKGHEREQVDAPLDDNHRLADFAEASADWFWEMDAERRYTFISDVIAEKVGRDAGWFLGKTHDEIVGRFYVRSEWEPFFKAFKAR